jgi:hypothetical protein
LGVLQSNAARGSVGLEQVGTEHGEGTERAWSAQIPLKRIEERLSGVDEERWRDGVKSLRVR